MLFASQAALVIANARRYQEERQARTDLETLIDTSPVGVVVFDVVTGLPKSLNREARRIVDSLRAPDQSPEDLLEEMTFVRADGREISLQEFPLAAVVEHRVRPCGPRRSFFACQTGGASPCSSTPRPSFRRRGASSVLCRDHAGHGSRWKNLERLRAEFLATVSHELRTPLTSIKGSAATALGSAADLDPAVARQFFRIIEDQADHMHDLVSDLLDVARIETGTLAVSPEPAEAPVLVDRARNAFISAGGRNNLAIDIEPALPLVMADRRRIVQVLGNLLANAARHSSESSVIRVTAVRKDLYVALSVADEGRGIPAESLPHLFRKFSRTESDDQGGDTGLGLAICKGIIEAHGGRIWAESDGPDRGARFTFTLPVADQPGTGATDDPAPLTARSSHQAAENQVRVLVVEDDPQALRYVRDVLAKAGFVPVVTGDPAEVLPLVVDKAAPPGLAGSGPAGRATGSS